MSENEDNVKNSKNYKYNKYNIINIKPNNNKETLDLDLQNYKDKLLFLADKNRCPITFYLSPFLWDEFNRVIKNVDPFLSRSQILEKLIIDYCLRNNDRNLKLTQFIFNQPKQVNIHQKIKLNIAQKLELKLVKQDLTTILNGLEQKRGDQNFLLGRLREVLPKAVRLYQKTSNAEIAVLLEKAEKYV